MSLHTAVYDQYEVALDRRNNGGEDSSYTAYLYRQGLDKILKKCGEETFEVVIAAKGDDLQETLGELNDVLYHVTVLLCELDVTLDAVLEALNHRCAVEGNTLDELFQIILERRSSQEEGSYTRYLYEQGIDKILKKVGEALSLLLLAAKNGDKAQTVEETANLLYHLMVMMADRGLSPAALEAELDKRSQKKGNLKKFHTTDVNT
ncbi:MAG: phosphoribosyl-ATP diphosphatase [Oscillospiraceae bacterium]|nr:phosphoribosyl-ATP diphosphatase [Oscillospiraceae bacterium]